MLGATAPTDVRNEDVDIVGHTYSDGVNRQALGGGLMVKEDAPKSVSTITRDYIEKQAPGLNPMQLIQLLPGVNTSDSDPLGLTGGNMTVRGMTQAQISFTLEGFPINDIGSFQVYPQEIVDSENLRTVHLEQGSADLDSPSINATGGAVNMYMIDPKKRFGGRTDFTYGSYGATRGFLRIDTGLIGNTNMRAYFSFSDAEQDMWRGPGHSSRKHAEMKVVNDWGQGNRISLAIVGNTGVSSAFPTVNMSSWKKYGIGVMGGPIATSKDANGATVSNTVYASQWTGTNLPTVYKSPQDTVTAANYNYYKLNQNPFTNIYASAPSTFTLTNHLVLTETPYFWYGDGGRGSAYSENLASQQYGSHKVTGSIGGYTSSSAKGAANDILLYGPTITETYRPGSVTKVTLTNGVNRLMIGYWFEYSKQMMTSPYGMIAPDGSPVDVWGGGPHLVLSNGMTAQYRDSVTQTTIHVPFIGDTLSLFHNRLTIDAGLKYAIVSRRGKNNLPDTSTGPYITQHWATALPTAAFRFKVNNENQLFASVSTNFREPANYGLYDAGTYYSNGGYSTHGSSTVRPEISISEEFGWRYQGPLVASSLSYFHYNFTNRLYSQTTVDPENPANYWTTNLNAGGAHSNGVDFEIGTRPLYNIRPYFSAEYLDARTDSNLVDTATIKVGTKTYTTSGAAATKGKVAPQAPKYQFGFGLDYDNGHEYGSFNLKYVARQYSTFINDQSIPGYVRMNISVGYRFRDWGFFKSPHIQLNLQNISDNRYLGSVSSPRVTALGTTATNGAKITPAAPTYTIASPFAALASISTGF
nr:TonB-dependent receptor [Gluconacetobacter sacchari]